MSLKLHLARGASLLERIFDAIIPRRSFDAAEIDPYFGHATPNEIILRGRVLSRRTVKSTKEIDNDSSLWANFKAMIALFNTREISDVKIKCRGYETYSDEEGYFELALPRPPDQIGWIDQIISYGEDNASSNLAALLPSPEAEFGIISDIDDTLIKTDAWSLVRNLWNSLTGNAETRYVFPDAIALIQSLHAGVNPVFYVSSSPWNMHAFLTEIFDRAGLVKGPKFLRDLGLSDRKFITGSQSQHKGEAIDELLEANPELAFVLMGDTGQRDAAVYYDAILRHPGRIRQIILRAPTPILSKESQIWVDKIKESQVPVFVGETYDPLLQTESETNSHSRVP